MTVTPGWAVFVYGEKTDLDDLRYLLFAPFDPWVEDYPMGGETKLLLRSKDWANLTDARDVNEDASRILAQAHGAALVVDADARACTAGGLCKFDANGSRELILVAGGINISLRGSRARGRSAPPNPPQESSVQRWLREAKNNEIRAELLLHLSRADNWFDLYKSMELAEALKGGMRPLQVSIGGDATMWETVRRTANHYRHAPNPSRNTLPPSPPQLYDARKFVLKMVATIL